VNFHPFRTQASPELSKSLKIRIALLEFCLCLKPSLKPPRYDYLLSGAFSLCNIAQAAEDRNGAI
jgi:hypothetical protein